MELGDVAPMIAKPFSPGNAFPADEVARERLTFDKAMIGSCTNGSYDDLLQAALVLRGAREQELILGQPARGAHEPPADPIRRATGGRGPRGLRTAAQGSVVML